MATNYPGSLDTSTQQPSPLSTTEMDDAGFEHDVVHTNHSGAIIALETKVGTGSSTAVANSVLAGTGSGTSGWTTAPSLAGLTVDTDTLYVDATNDRVGIGDTSPSYELDVSGQIRATSNVRGGAFLMGTSDDGLRSVTGSYGSVQTTGEGLNGWEGYSISGHVVFMANSSTGNFGIYDDVNNKWALYCDYNGTTDIRYNGTAIATTLSGGLSINGDIYVQGLDVVFGSSSSNDYIRYSDGAQGAMGGRFEFVADGSSANSQIVAGTGIFLRDGSLANHDNYQDSTSDYNVVTAVANSGSGGGNWTDMTVICEDDGTNGSSCGTSFHADYHNYAPIWRSTTSGGEGLAARSNTETAFIRLLASAFQVNSTEDSKQEIVDAPPLLQRFRDYVAEGHHTKQFRRKEVANPKPAYEQKYAAIERDYGKEEADRWLEERTLQNIWTRTDANWLELDKMQNGVEFTEFGVVIDEFGPAFPEVAAWEANEDGTEMVPVGLDLSSAIGFLMRLVEDLDEENQTLEARVAALEAA